MMPRRIRGINVAEAWNCWPVMSTYFEEQGAWSFSSVSSVHLCLLRQRLFHYKAYWSQTRKQGMIEMV